MLNFLTLGCISPKHLGMVTPMWTAHYEWLGVGYVSSYPALLPRITSRPKENSAWRHLFSFLKAAWKQPSERVGELTLENTLGSAMRHSSITINPVLPEVITIIVNRLQQAEGKHDREYRSMTYIDIWALSYDHICLKVGRCDKGGLEKAGN
ncbi:MAG: hypothetical protein HXX08_14820 [Chloroflexi bacterium]|uniref:Uncharacterized protein n=1 Tax=Candidatus Chlorohelix allophototropha TaxID=3003348 RepID=A0A8T7M4U5_9CHLR|nr:hypothetical protein [Chloroflexota bacterium]WJW70293.1 hypothetical protein OZ401_005024 [Chloroflexota bacterium L227-S17]